MTKSVFFLILASACFPALLQAADSKAAMPTRIEVFTNDRYPVSGTAPAQIPTKTYDLDAPAKLDEALSAGLPPDPEQAKTIALKRLESLGTAKLAERVIEAYRGITQAMSYELVKIPAVVFDDGASVIYGVSDIGEAIRHYQAWRLETSR